MVSSQANQVFHRIRSVALQQNGGAADGDLLEHYVRQKDEAAFEALVRRHCRMVLGVCRRVLGNSHDAEDAFQATFLVLVRKAASIRPAAMVGNWLYGVAYRTALEARRAAVKRRAKEAQVTPRTEALVDDADDDLAHLRPLLDQELTRLPDKFRTILVLCDLEGRTRKEAAQQLGLPDGTVASRLSRARAILTKRLTRRGVTLASGAVAANMAQETVSASAPLALVSSTIKAATAYAAGPAAASMAVSAPVAALTEGVLKAMLLKKLKITVLFVAAMCVVGTGWGGLCYRPAANAEPVARAAQQQVAQTGAQKSSDANKPQELDLEKFILDMVQKGVMEYQAANLNKTGERPSKEALQLYQEAFMKGFVLSSELAKAMNKKPAGDKAPSPDLKAPSPDLKAPSPDLNAEAFLKAFQVSREIANALAKKAPVEKNAAAPQDFDRAQALKRLEVLERMVQELRKKLDLGK